MNLMTTAALCLGTFVFVVATGMWLDGRAIKRHEREQRRAGRHPWKGSR